MEGYSSRYDCRWIISQRKVSEIVKHIRPFLDNYAIKNFYRCLHNLILNLEELEEFKKLRKPRRSSSEFPRRYRPAHDHRGKRSDEVLLSFSSGSEGL